MAIKDIFDKTEKIIKEDMYVLVENYKTYQEEVIGAYDTELLAFRDAKRMGLKNKKVFKADVEYIAFDTIQYMWDYTIKE